MTATAPPERQRFQRELRVRVGGDYYAQVPGDATGEPLPLLLFLHGMHHADSLFELDAPPRLARERGLPMIVVSPLCTEMRWDADVLLGLLEETQERYAVDPGRIYVSGISIGGLATWELALRRPDLFAAIAPICGAGQPWNAFRIRHVPAWIFHGARDDVVPVRVSEEMAEALRESGGAPRLTIYPEEGHRAWGRAYAEPGFWAWLREQRTTS